MLLQDERWRSVMLPSLPKKSGTSQGKGVDDCYRGGHDRGRRQDPIVLNFDITISWWKTVGFWIGNHHNMQLMLFQIWIQFHQKWITSLNFFLQSYLLSSFIKVSLSFLIFFFFIFPISFSILYISSFQLSIRAYTTVRRLPQEQASRVVQLYKWLYGTHGWCQPCMCWCWHPRAAKNSMRFV